MAGALLALEDEIGLLAQEFNLMSAALFETQESLADAAEENEQLYREAQRRINELALVNQINYTVMASLDVETTIDAVLRNIKTLTDYTSAEINLFDQETKTFKVHAVGDASYSAAVGYRYQLDEGLTGWIFSNMETLLIPDIQEFSQVKPKLPVDDFSLRSFIGLPLSASEDHLGTLELAHQRPRFYSKDDLQSLQTLMGQAALAIRHAQLFQESQDHAQGQELLAAIAAIASSSLQLDDLLKGIMTQTIHALNAEKGAVFLLDEAGKTLYPHPSGVVGFYPADED
jgi:GAF domain-containing protein